MGDKPQFEHKSPQTVVVSRTRRLRYGCVRNRLGRVQVRKPSAKQHAALAYGGSGNEPTAIGSAAVRGAVAPGGARLMGFSL
jgi:hypothetical protein